MADPLTLLYLPTAVLLGALHALEPGHAKTLTAAYLIGIKGTKRDAVLLGLSVAATHSVVVIALSVAALWLGREAFTDAATYWLQVGSGLIVIMLGVWLFWKRWGTVKRQRARNEKGHHHDHEHDHQHEHDGVHSHSHDHEHDHAHGHHHESDHAHQHEHEDRHGHHTHSPEGVVASHFHSHEEESHGHSHSYAEHGHSHSHDDHDLLTDDEHAAAHAATMPKYVGSGERPSPLQIMAFGGAGGMIPCPASITVMLLALSVGQTGFGLVTVLGFSVGLAITLVGVGLVIVAGVSKLESTGRFAWVTRQAPLFSAGLVIFSGVVAIAMSALHH